MSPHSAKDIFDLGQAFIMHIDRRLLDMATEPGGPITIEDYRRWTFQTGHSLIHLWAKVQVRDCIAASWQDACREFGVQHWAEGWNQIRLDLLDSWGVRELAQKANEDV